MFQLLLAVLVFFGFTACTDNNKTAEKTTQSQEEGSAVQPKASAPLSESAQMDSEDDSDEDDE